MGPTKVLSTFSNAAATAAAAIARQFESFVEGGGEYEEDIEELEEYEEDGERIEKDCIENSLLGGLSVVYSPNLDDSVVSSSSSVYFEDHTQALQSASAGLCGGVSGVEIGD